MTFKNHRNSHNAGFPRRPQRSTLRALGLLTVLTTACSGPLAPLNIGAKDVPLDLVLGARKVVARAPVPPLAFDVDVEGLPTFALPDLPESPRPRKGTPPVARQVCTGGHRPAAPAPSMIIWPPAEAAYTYAVDGSWTLGDRKTVLPSTATVEVKNPETLLLPKPHPVTTGTPVSGLWYAAALFPLESSWQVAVTIGGSTTTTSYRSRSFVHVVQGRVPQQVEEVTTVEKVHVEGDYATREEYIEKAPAAFSHGYTVAVRRSTVEPTLARTETDPEKRARRERQATEDKNKPSDVLFAVELPPFKPDVPSYPAPGLIDNTAQPNYEGVAGLYIEKVEQTGWAPFQPTAPLLLARYPLTTGTTFDSASSDGVTTMAFRTTIGVKQIVRLCNIPIDTWTIDLTKGRWSKADTTEVAEFTARYQVAPQYGGLFVAESVNVVGRQGVDPIARSVSTLIQDAPKFPGLDGLG